MMSLKWFNCIHCGFILKKESVPDDSGCRVKARHHWIEIGEDGEIYYECEKCGFIVKTKSLPLKEGCSVMAVHSWKKLKSYTISSDKEEKAENPETE